MPFVTGDNPGAATFCRQLNIPDDVYFLAALNGALLSLADAENWEQLGDATPAEYAALAQIMVDDYEGSSC